MNISYKEIGYDYDKDDCEEEELFFKTGNRKGDY